MTGSAPEARRYSLKLLAYRGRSEQELRERLLRKGFDACVTESVIEDLKTAGFIDDALLAAGLKRQAREGRLLGHNAARLFLQRRGVARDVVESVMDYDEEDELRTLRKLIEKKTRLSGAPQTPRDRQRLWNFLVRKGYSTGVIRRAMNNPDFDEEAL